MKKLPSDRAALSDAEALRLSLERPWLFEVIVDRYQKAFLRRSTQVLHSSEAAEDVVQETFLKIYKNAWQFSERSGAKFSSWAYKILLNTCWSEIERRRRNGTESLDFSDLDSYAAVTLPVEAERDDKSYVDSILHRMPASLSKFLRMYFLEDKSQREIAHSEGMSEVAVRSRIHRAKESFRRIALNLV